MQQVCIPIFKKWHALECSEHYSQLPKLQTTQMSIICKMERSIVVNSHNVIIYSSEKWVIYSFSQWQESHKHIEWKILDRKIHTVWFHVYKIQKQLKLFNVITGPDSDYRRWERGCSLETDIRESGWGADDESSSGCPLHGSVKLVGIHQALQSSVYFAMCTYGNS